MLCGVHLCCTGHVFITSSNVTQNVTDLLGRQDADVLLVRSRITPQYYTTVPRL